MLVVQFTLAGQEYMALNGGMRFEYTHAISFKIDCADQAEVDRLWEGCRRRRIARAMRLAQGSLRRVLADRAVGACRNCSAALIAPAAQRAMQAMMKMVKLDIAALQKAYDGG